MGQFVHHLGGKAAQAILSFQQAAQAAQERKDALLGGLISTGVAIGGMALLASDKRGKKQCRIPKGWI